MLLYHATSEENAFKILKDGKIKCHHGMIYLATGAAEAVTFISLYGYDSIICMEIELDDSYEIEESFDHNRKFLPFDAYVVYKDIPEYMIKNYWKYDMKEVYNNAHSRKSDRACQTNK